MRAYQPRAIAFLRRVPHRDWQVKTYSIAFGRKRIDEARFAPGLELALRALPEPAITDARPGAAFCILHQGRGADYVVAAWWDRENELPLRVFVRTPDDAEWRPAMGSESVCVWDLDVIAFERDAYVRTVLADPPAEVGDYLSAVFTQPTREPPS